MIDYIIKKTKLFYQLTAFFKYCIIKKILNKEKLEMNSWERFKRAYEHKEADRVPIEDNPWNGTLKRWHDEGMPHGVDWRDFFGVDKVSTIDIDISPRLPEKIIEKTDRYTIKTNAWGATLKCFNELDSTPEMLDFKVTTMDAWEEVKARMTLDDDRIPWKMLEENYPKWRADGHWLRGVFWFGFDVTHSNVTGTETMLISMIEEPEFIEDIFETSISRCEALYDRLWDAGYHFDEVLWYDDMGYKGTTFFSPSMYRNILKPYHKRAVDWAHNRGIYAQLHSCGNIMTLVDDIVDIGTDALNPLEIKAGMDAIKLKQQYGDKLLFRGGINAQKWDDLEYVTAEINEKVPVMKENGGFVFSSDHSIPSSVSLENMKHIVATAKEAGKY